MHEALVTLVDRRRPVELEVWRSFWDRLHEGGLRRGETAAVLASLSTAPPEGVTLTALLDSLAERRPTLPAEPMAGTVNIVGTGGGPRTFNISTAAALTAAAMGVRVVKTGSRAWSARHGSVDLLEMLGIPLTGSYEETHEALERDGIAFAGPFVYPAELTLLGRSILPLGMRDIGRFVNTVGPFLSCLPVPAALTGVSDPRQLAMLEQAAVHLAHRTGRTTWLCDNDLGADELLSFAPSRVSVHGDGVAEQFTLRPHLLVPYQATFAPSRRPARTLGAPAETPSTSSTRDSGRHAESTHRTPLLHGQTLPDAAPGAGTGELGELAPVLGDDDEVMRHFEDVLSGVGPAATWQTVALNAAALAVAGGRTADWHEALAAAHEALHGGGARALLGRLRTRVVAGG